MSVGEQKRITIPLQYENQIQSLCWVGDKLFDFAGGFVGISLEGKIDPPKFIIGYKFDGAVASEDGHYVIVYEKYGTKGLVFKEGKLIREINRSYYHADVYEYPLAVFSANDKALLAHCPENYNVIEIEEIETATRLTAQNSTEIDFFQSRLQVSPNQKLLLSAGWIWQPLDSVLIYDISNLSTPQAHGPVWESETNDTEIFEINEAVFMDDNLLLISGAEDQENLDGNREVVVVYDLQSKKVVSRVLVERPTGTLMPVDKNHAVSFFDTPKLMHLSTGKILHEWNDIPVSTPNSSIKTPLKKLSIIAIDREKKRFAIVTDQAIEVIALA